MEFERMLGWDRFTCGFDANLNFPFDDAGWAAFAREVVYEGHMAGAAGQCRAHHGLARLDNLPKPQFIVRSDMDAAISHALKEALLGIRPKRGAGAHYAGFAAYQDKLMQRLFADLAGLPDLAYAA